MKRLLLSLALLTPSLQAADAGTFQEQVAAINAAVENEYYRTHQWDYINEEVLGGQRGRASAMFMLWTLLSEITVLASLKSERLKRMSPKIARGLVGMMIALYSIPFIRELRTPYEFLEKWDEHKHFVPEELLPIFTELHAEYKKEGWTFSLLRKCDLGLDALENHNNVTKYKSAKRRGLLRRLLGD